MSAHYSGEDASFVAGLEELQRGALALARNSSRPHKQLVQKGEFVHNTGNVVSLASGLVRKPLLEEIEEVLDQSSRTTPSSVSTFLTNEPSLARSQLTITGKVFIQLDGVAIASDVQDVVTSALNELESPLFDLLIFAIPDGASVGAVLELWLAAEAVYTQGLATRLGVSNISFDSLQALYASVNVKPAVVEMSMAATTGNATELLNYIKSNGMDALIDSDARHSSLENKEQKYGRMFNAALVPPYTRTVFEPVAVLRHVSVVSDRGIVANKSYTLKTRYTIA